MELLPDLGDVAILDSEPGRQLYRAYHSGLDRPVAVQGLSIPVADDESLARFEQTCARIHGLTRDAHIAPLHAWGLTQDGSPYVVTDLLEVGSLADRVRETGPLPVVDALRVGVVVAEALAGAHERHAVHGDVRLDNLLVAPSGEPVLGGFGLSALAADPTSGAPLPAHAAPEIVEGGTGDAASDLYSLGSTLLTLLTGCGPEAALVDCLNRADESAGWPALPPGADGRPLPEEVVGILARMTATDPKQRPPNAHSAARALRAAQEPDHAMPARASSSPPAPHGAGDDDGLRIQEPKLSVFFDAWDTPAVTRHRVPQREPEPVPAAGVAARVRFVPADGTAPPADGTAPAAEGGVLAAEVTVPASEVTVPASEVSVSAPPARVGNGGAVARKVVRPGPWKAGRPRRRAVPLAAAAVLVVAAIGGILLAANSESSRPTSVQQAADQVESATTPNSPTAASSAPPAIVGTMSDNNGRAAAAGPQATQQD